MNLCFLSDELTSCLESGLVIGNLETDILWNKQAQCHGLVSNNGLMLTSPQVGTCAENELISSSWNARIAIPALQKQTDLREVK